MLTHYALPYQNLTYVYSYTYIIVRDQVDEHDCGQADAARSSLIAHFDDADRLQRPDPEL